MSKRNGHLGVVVQRLRRAAVAKDAAQLSDRELLRRYVQARDETAFAVLVRRHGPMVLGLCGRVLRHHQDAEDAFQAAFLVLARKAGNVRKSESLASWLHSVAYRAASKLRAARARRFAPLDPLNDVPDPASFSEPDGQCILEEELNRLADKYRAPLLLCCVQGRTRDEAARQLGWSLGVLRGRLDRGRELLRVRLARRGVELAAVLLPLGIAGVSEAALVPHLVSSTVRAALATAQFPAAVSAQAAVLAQGVIHAMFMTKVKCFALTFCVLTLVGTGAGVATYQAEAGGRQRDTTAQPLPARAGQPDRADNTAELKREIDRLRLELEQARLLLKVANEEILRLRAGRKYVDPTRRASELARSVPDPARGTAGPARTTSEPARKTSEPLSGPPGLRPQPNATRAQRQDRGLGLPRRGSVKTMSPDEKLFAMAQDQSFSLFDAATGKELRRFQGHRGEVTALAFSPDGKRLASGSKDKSAIIWDLASGKILAKITLSDPIDQVSYSPDGQSVKVRAREGHVEVDAQTGKISESDRGR